MSRISIVDYTDKFDDLIRNINRSGNTMYYAFRLDGEYEWEHQITNERVRLINPVFLFRNMRGLFLVKSFNGERILDYIYHANISGGGFCEYMYGCSFDITHFCTNNFNAMSMEDFKANLELNIATVKLLLPDQNPSSAYQDPAYSMLMTEFDRSVCKMEYKKSNILSLVTGRRNPTKSDIARLYREGYYIKRKYESWYSHVDDKNAVVSSMQDGILSKYYKVIPAFVINKLVENMSFVYDVMCIGCGSSGSNILSQLGKTQSVRTYALVDKDIVKENNLKNTTFRTSHLMAKKVGVLSDSLREALSLFGDNKKEIDVFDNWLEDLVGKFDISFLVSGVDKLTLRKELFNAENIKRKYYIDAGYQGLSSSIFIIDMEDEEQIEYYNNLLDNSIKSYVEDVLPDASDVPRYRWDRFRKDFSRYDARFDMCRSKFLNHKEKWFKELWSKVPLKEKEQLLHDTMAERQTCQSPNIVDIYTITSGIIASTVRNIKDGKAKPFTHLELDTSTGMPLTMVVRK